MTPDVIFVLFLLVACVGIIVMMRRHADRNPALPPDSTATSLPAVEGTDSRPSSHTAAARSRRE